MPFRIYTSLSVQAKAGLPGQLSVHLRTAGDHFGDLCCGVVLTGVRNQRVHDDSSLDCPSTGSRLVTGDRENDREDGDPDEGHPG